MEENEYLSESILLSNILAYAGDTDLKKGLTKGFYVSQLQKAIEELSIATFYDIITGDYPLNDKTLQLELPKNCFNIREIYLWNGSCCQPQYSVIVHYKRLMNNKQTGGTQYTALRSDINGASPSDPFYAPYLNSQTFTKGPYTLYWAGVQNGLLMFSSNSKGYKNVRIVYNGFGGEIGDPPLVPRLFRSVVEDYVVYQAFRTFMAKDRSYRILYKDMEDKLFNERTGTWWEAKKRIAALDSWSRKDMTEYQNRPNS